MSDYIFTRFTFDYIPCPICDCDMPEWFVVCEDCEEDWANNREE